MNSEALIRDCKPCKSIGPIKMSKTKVFFLWDVRKELKDFLKQELRDVHTVRLEFPSAPTDEFLLEAATN
jgi:hypothetical protein